MDAVEASDTAVATVVHLTLALDVAVAALSRLAETRHSESGSPSKPMGQEQMATWLRALQRAPIPQTDRELFLVQGSMHSLLEHVWFKGQSYTNKN